MDRGGDIPEGLEILDAEGAVIASGLEAAETSAEEPDDAPRSRRWPLVVGAAAIVAAVGVVLVLLFTDDEPATEPPAPLGMLAGAGLTVAPEGAATYPLFGREWQHELMVGTPSGWTFIDLNTGAQRTVPVPDESTTDATVRDGTVFVLVDDTVHRLEGDRLTEVWTADVSALFSSVALANGIAVLENRESGPRMFDVATGTELQPGPSRRIVLAAGLAYAQHGQHILAFDGSGTPSTWATGELLAAGASAVIWRSCDGTDCTFWAGTPEDPHAAQLDTTTARHVFLERPDYYAEFLTLEIELMSPTGRLAWSISSDPSTFEFEFELVDLITGDFTLIELAESAGGLGVFDPSESVFVIHADGEVLVVDTATGSVVAIPGVEASSGTLLFVPSG
ncbi:MAG: hypothetical protein R8F63_15250 [Acidimicrobiales bacterium]|nr:hypothetical protein [Acidimicrobiales bacterium]